MIFYRMISIKWQTWNVNWVCAVSGHVSPPRPGAGSGIEASDVRRLGNVICGILMHGPSPGSSDHWTLDTKHRVVRGDLTTPGHSRYSAPGISHWLHKLNAWISPPSSIHIISPIIIIIVPFQCWTESWMEAWSRSEAGAPGVFMPWLCVCIPCALS